MGSDEFTLRVTLYFFAVTISFIANRHSEVENIMNGLKTSCLMATKRTLLSIDRS